MLDGNWRKESEYSQREFEPAGGIRRTRAVERAAALRLRQANEIDVEVRRRLEHRLDQVDGQSTKSGTQSGTRLPPSGDGADASLPIGKASIGIEKP